MSLLVKKKAKAVCKVHVYISYIFYACAYSPYAYNLLKKCIAMCEFLEGIL